MSAEALSAPVGAISNSAASLEGGSPSVSSTSSALAESVSVPLRLASVEVGTGTLVSESRVTLSAAEVLGMPQYNPQADTAEIMAADSARLAATRALLAEMVRAQKGVSAELPNEAIVTEGGYPEQPKVPLFVASEVSYPIQGVDAVGEEETPVFDPVFPHDEFTPGLVGKESTPESEVDGIDEVREEVTTLTEEPEFEDQRKVDEGVDEQAGENDEELNSGEDVTDSNEAAEGESEVEVEEDGEPEEIEESEEDESMADKDQPEEEKDKNDKENDENNKQDPPRPGPIVDEGANKGRIDVLVDAARESHNNNGQVEGDALAAALRRTSGLESGIVKQISAPVEDGTLKFIEGQFSGQTYADTTQATQAIVSTVMDNTAVDVGFGPAVGEEAVNKVLGGNMPKLLPDRRTKAA